MRDVGAKNRYTLDYLIQTMLLLILISALFLPSFRITSTFAIRLDDIILLAISPIIVFLIVSIRQELFTLNRYFILYCVLIGTIVFSCLHGYIFLSVPFSGGDLNEVFRLFKSLVVIVLVSFINIKSFEFKLNKVVKWGSVYIVFLGFVQYFNPIGLGDILAKIYGEHHAEIMIDADSGSKRVILSGAGPNDGALIALFLYIYMIFLFLKTKRYEYFMLSIGLFACILFTSSRTTLLAASFVFLLVLFKHASYIYRLIFGGFIVLIILYVLPYFQYIYVGFQMALEGTNTSLLKRFDKWDDAFKLFEQSRLVGWGIAKSIHITVVDSEYLLTLRRYGIVGFVLLLLFVYFPFLSKKKGSIVLANLTKSIAISSLFIMMTGNFFNSYQTITAYVLFVAVSCRSYNESLNYLSVNMGNTQFN